jgi:uncharacterized membrane protein
VARALSPVALCYGIGILFGNLPGIEIVEGTSKTAGGLAVLLAIPLLLFAVDVRAWVGAARSTVVASVIAFASIAAVSVAAGAIFLPHVDQAPIVAGSLAGVYTGGTPSMVAVAQALQLAPETLILLNLSDVLVAGPYFLLLLAGAYRLYGTFLPPPPAAPAPIEAPAAAAPSSLRGTLTGLGLAVLVAGGSIGLATLLPAELRDVATIILVSTIALGASFVRRVRELPGTARLSEYVLLIFCAAIGSLADFSRLAQADGLIVLFTASVFIGGHIVQFALYALFRIDRDTAVMASVASTFSPLFVAPLATRMGNRNALVSGVAIGLMGYAIAVYVGLAVARIVAGLG